MMLEAKGIREIGQLAALTPDKLELLPFHHPRAGTLKRVLAKWHAAHPQPPKLLPCPQESSSKGDESLGMISSSSFGP